MARGKIKWFNTKNGLGLIVDDQGGQVRLHFSAIKDDSYKTLKEGDEVEFEAREGRRGPEAVTVVKV